MVIIPQPTSGSWCQSSCVFMSCSPWIWGVFLCFHEFSAMHWQFSPNFCLPCLLASLSTNKLIQLLSRKEHRSSKVSMVRRSMLSSIVCIVFFTVWLSCLCRYVAVSAIPPKISSQSICSWLLSNLVDTQCLTSFDKLSIHFPYSYI